MAGIPPAGSAKKGTHVKTLSGIALLAALVVTQPALAECNDRAGPNVVTGSTASAIAHPVPERHSAPAARSGPNIAGEAVSRVEKPRSGNPRATSPAAEPRPCVKCVAI